jgi:chromosome segregation ATPase
LIAESLQEEKAMLEQTVEAKNERVETLENQITEDQEQIAILEEHLAVKEKHCLDIENEFSIKDKYVQDLMSQFSAKQNYIQDLEGQNKALQGQLELDQRLQEQTEQERQQHEQEIYDLNEALNAAQKALDEEMNTSKDQQTYLNFKLTEIANLHKKIDSTQAALGQKNDELALIKQNLTKTQLCLDGLTEVTVEQKVANVKVEKELRKTVMINERLVKEYEVAKAKVRKYRKSNNNSCSTINSVNDEAAAAAASNDDVDHHRVESLKRQLEVTKMAFVRQGANQALTKANAVYSDHLKKLYFNHNHIMTMMRQRLEELANFLQQILSNGLLDLMSDSVKEALQKSLNESLRFSQSVLNNTTTDFDDTREDPFRQLDAVEVTWDDLELGPLEDFDSVLAKLKEEHWHEAEQLTVRICQLENLYEQSQAYQVL